MQIISSIAWRLYERLPQGADALVASAQDYLKLFANLRVPLYRIHGPSPASDQPRTMLIAGVPASLQYLVQRFCGANPKWESLGSIPIYALPRVLRERAPDVNLVAAQVQRLLAQWLFGEHFLHVPEAVGAQLEVRADGTTFASVHKTAKRNIEHVCKNALAWRISHQLADFERFYDDMYVPFARQRYGALAFVRNRHALRRRFRQGGIIWITHRDEIIAGQIFQIHKSILHLLGPGTPQGSPAPVKQGAFSALYMFAAAYAQQQGLRWLDLGASMPSLRDGVLMHKRGWGATLTERQESSRELLLRWGQWDDELARFFADVPLIFRDQNGLSALTAVPEHEPITAKTTADLQNTLIMPGLYRLYVIASDGQPPPGDGSAADTARVWIASPNPPESFRTTALPSVQSRSSPP